MINAYVNSDSSYIVAFKSSFPSIRAKNDEGNVECAENVKV